jgi:preprotein translocase subunit SecE
MARIRPAKSQDRSGNGPVPPGPPAPPRRRPPPGDPGEEGGEELRADPPARRVAVPAGAPLSAKLSRFVADVIAELRKVSWPTRPQLMQATAVVVLVVAVISAYLALVDAIFERVVDAIF